MSATTTTTAKSCTAGSRSRQLSHLAAAAVLAVQGRDLAGYEEAAADWEKVGGLAGWTRSAARLPVYRHVDGLKVRDRAAAILSWAELAF